MSLLSCTVITKVTFCSLGNIREKDVVKHQLSNKNTFLTWNKSLKYKSSLILFEQWKGKSGTKITGNILLLFTKIKRKERKFGINFVNGKILKNYLVFCILWMLQEFGFRWNLKYILLEKQTKLICCCTEIN